MGRVSHEGSMAFCISGAKQYRQQRAAFLTGLCICRQHCAVNRINVGKIIRCLRLPQFAVRHADFLIGGDFFAPMSPASCVECFAYLLASSIWFFPSSFPTRIDCHTAAPEKIISNHRQGIMVKILPDLFVRIRYIGQSDLYAVWLFCFCQRP